MSGYSLYVCIGAWEKKCRSRFCCKVEDSSRRRKREADCLWASLGCRGITSCRAEDGELLHTPFEKKSQANWALAGLGWGCNCWAWCGAKKPAEVGLFLGLPVWALIEQHGPWSLSDHWVQIGLGLGPNRNGKNRIKIIIW